jgi:hypothetical protein
MMRPLAMLMSLVKKNIHDFLGRGVSLAIFLSSFLLLFERINNQLNNTNKLSPFFKYQKTAFEPRVV